MSKGRIIQLGKAVLVAQEVPYQNLSGFCTTGFLFLIRNGFKGSQNNLLVFPGCTLDNGNGCGGLVLGHQAFCHFVNHLNGQENGHGSVMRCQRFKFFLFRHWGAAFQTGTDNGL